MLKLLEVSTNVYQRTHFEIYPEELDILFENVKGIVEGNQVILFDDTVDIQKTKDYHSGDLRIWYKDGGYDTIQPEQIIIECKSDFIIDYLDWLEETIPTMYNRLYLK